MPDASEKEIQKTLEEMKKRAEEFQAGGNYSSSSRSFDSFSNSKLKLILTIVGVVIVLIISVIFYIKSGEKAQSPFPKDIETINQQNMIEKIK